MKLSIEAYQANCDENNGYCTKCKDITNFGGTEPDAENYECEVCESKSVYGIEQGLLIGYIVVE